MKKHLLKVVGVVLAMTMVLSACGCKKKEKESEDQKAVREAIEECLDAMKDGDFEGMDAYVVEGENAFAAIETEGDDKDVWDAMMEKLEYEVSDIEADEDEEEGSATVTLTMVDMEAVISDLEDGYEVDDVVSAIEDSEDTVEEEVELTLIFDDEWFIESTEELLEVVVAGTEDLSFSSVNAASAEALVDEFMTALAAGNVADAKSLTLDGLNDDSESFSEELVCDFYAEFFSNSTYTVEVLDEAEDSVTLNIALDNPNIAEAFELMYSDPWTLAPIYADYILAIIEEDYDAEIDESAMMETLIPFLGQVSITTTDVQCSVVADETKPNGIALDISLTLIGSDVQIDSFSEEKLNEILSCSLDILLNNGSITQAEYDMYLAYFLGDMENLPSGSDSFYYIEGDDFWYCELLDSDGLSTPSIPSGASSFSIEVMTYSYPCQPLTYKVYLNDEIILEDYTLYDTVAGDTFYAGVESTDGSALADGVYKIEVYAVDGITLIVTAYVTIGEVA
ncbi:MAG TPA: hypothetical protein PK567_03685 [Bacillota bacterium]|nr:hypothetical protein [Bacillota bacterium]